MFAAGLPFPVPEIPEFIAFRNSGRFFPATFPELSSRTPAKTPETATAFSSFLNTCKGEREKRIENTLNLPLSLDFQ